jgi:hypothetical protein
MSAKISKGAPGHAEGAKAKPTTGKPRVAARMLAERKRAAPGLDPVGKYMHDHRGVLGKDYKLSH